MFLRKNAPPGHALGTGTPLPVETFGGQLAPVVTWTREHRQFLARLLPALTVLRAAGLHGGVHVLPGDEDVMAEVRLRSGAVLGVAVEDEPTFRLVPRDPRDAGTKHQPTDEIDSTGGSDPRRALEDVVYAVSSLVAETRGVGELPAPLRVTAANLQLLPGTGALPERWGACIFITRDHEVPTDADAATRDALWVDNTVGVKATLDGAITCDPHDVDPDPDGERSRTSLATAAQWAGQDVDITHCVRRLAHRTQELLGISLDPPPTDPQLVFSPAEGRGSK